MPAQAGIHDTVQARSLRVAWVPAFMPEACLRHDAGMTAVESEPYTYIARKC
jgi:hypothetical protein